MEQVQLQDFKETVSLRSRPSLYGIETLSARYLTQTFKPHAHDEYVFGVISGGVHAVWCRGEMNQVSCGSVVTMRPGDIHHGGAGCEDGWHQRMLYIPEAGINALLEDITGRAPAGALDFGAAFHARPDLARRFADLHTVLHASGAQLSVDVALDTLLGTLLREIAPQQSIPRQQEQGRIVDAIDYLDSHAEDDVSLDDLCEVTGLRRRQTIEAFRRATGLPPHCEHQAKMPFASRLCFLGGPTSPPAPSCSASGEAIAAFHFG